MKRKNHNRNRWIGILFTIIFIISQIPVLEASASGSGFVYITVEKLTIGQGFLIEPEKIEYQEGESVADLFDRVMKKHHFSYENGGSLKKDFYLSAIQNADTKKVRIPNLIAQKYGNNITENERKPTLGEFAYASSSGWYYYRNETAPDKSMSAQKVKDGDVIRVQFTLFGWGQDLSLAQNRQELIKAVAERKKESGYQAAISVLENFDATKAEIEAAYEKLTGKKLTSSSEQNTQNLESHTESGTAKNETKQEDKTAAVNGNHANTGNKKTPAKKQADKKSSRKKDSDSSKGKSQKEQETEKKAKTETKTELETEAASEEKTVESTKKAEKSSKKEKKTEQNTKKKEKTKKEKSSKTKETKESEISQSTESEDDSRLYQAMKKTADYIQKSDEVWDRSSQWHMIGLAESQIPISKETAELFYQNMEKTMKEEKGNLSSSKWTEYSKMILAVSALGKDATTLAGYPLVERLTEYDKVISQGMNGPIWALIALASRTEYQKGKEAVIEQYLQLLKENELEQGGFSLLGKQPGSEADADLTAMALLALEKYKDREGIPELITHTRQKLEAMQDQASGEYESGGVRNLESTAWACIAFVAAGEDIQDTRLQNALLSFQNEDGSFCHIKEEQGKANGMATEQGILALSACYLQEQQKKQKNGTVEPICLFDAKERQVQLLQNEENTQTDTKEAETTEKGNNTNEKTMKNRGWMLAVFIVVIGMAAVFWWIQKKKRKENRNAKRDEKN